MITTFRPGNRRFAYWAALRRTSLHPTLWSREPIGALQHLNSLAFQKLGKALALERIILHNEGTKFDIIASGKKQIRELAMVATGESPVTGGLGAYGQER